MGWIEVGDGVFARRYTELDQTLGLVVGARGCLVVDTGTDEVHGADMAAAVRGVTALPWSVVITHAHWDHFLGTAAFPGAAVWAHPACRAVIADETDSQVREGAAHYRDAGQPGLAARVERARVVLPDRAVACRATLDLGGRVVHLVHPGQAHTAGDLLVHVPDAGVVFAGDTVEQGAPPALGPDADPTGWAAALEVLVDMAPRVVVPGHGEPVDTAFVRRQRAELATVAELLDRVRSGELGVAAAVRRAPYPPEAVRPLFERT